MTAHERSLPAPPAIILVRPQLAVNIGTTARAMANFGLSDLRLVAPREPWPLAEPHRGTAEAAAAGAVALLRAARVFPTLEDAVADLHRLYATTARERGQGKAVMTPAVAMTSPGPNDGTERVGVLFGPERTGLGNDDVMLADAIITFPVDPAYGSLNLAQAVLLVAYEWFKGRTGDQAPFAAPEQPPRAPKRDVVALFDYLEGELTEAGYFRPEDKQPIMRRNLRNLLQRLEFSEQDVRTLRGVIVRLVEGPRRAGSRRSGEASLP